MTQTDYQQLLDATLRHLEDLQRQGQRFVPGDPSEVRRALTELALPGVRTAPPLRPALTASTPSAATSLDRPAATRDSTPAPAPSARPPASVQPAAPHVSPPLSREEKEAGIAALREKTQSCILCPHLASSRKHVVFGVGDIHSPLLFVGEAPGADEDRQGEPFVGAAGELLTKIILAMGLIRSQVYIANVLKCRPDTPGQSYGNRKPTSDEMKTCLPHLLEQIRLIQPRVIVALGATAMEGLFGKGQVFISKVRGSWHHLQGIAVMPTFHPSYVLRNQSLATKRAVWEDMMAVMERLNYPISEKQRGFFT